MPASIPALARLDAAAIEALHGRSMLLTQDWTTPGIEALCTLAEVLQGLDRAGRVASVARREPRDPNGQVGRLSQEANRQREHHVARVCR